MHVAVEACTGWYFVARALERAGAVPHLAEVAETRALRGRQRRDRPRRRALAADAALAGQVARGLDPARPHLLLRIRTRLRKTLSDEATAWRERIQATLFHLGLPSLPAGLEGERAREWLARLELPAAARERIEVCLQMIEALERQLAPVDTELRRFSGQQAGCLALQRHFGVGGVLAATILAELGDVGRLRRSRQAVRIAGLDVGVERSDRRARAGQAHQAGLAAAALGAV